MNEQWEKWEPIQNLALEYYIECISDNDEGFTILLFDSTNIKNKVVVKFENSIYAYRSTDESFRRNTLYTLHEQYGTKFYTEWTFFKVNNSKYIKWLSEESAGISESRELIHFSFIGADSILDVVATYEPKVEFIEK